MNKKKLFFTIFFLSLFFNNGFIFQSALAKDLLQKTTPTESPICPGSPGCSSRFQAKKTQLIKVVGMAEFVLRGTVTAVSANTITIHVANTTKNSKLFDNKYKTLNIGGKTTLTKNGRNISLGQIKAGDKVKVFGIFDKKTGTIILVRWVKVVVK